MSGMTRHPGSGTSTALLAAATAAVLCACTTAPPPRPEPAIPAPLAVPGESLTRYRCGQGLEFTVGFDGDAGMVDAGPRGRQLLLRDAGGLTPQQTVYSNTQLRAEFGLGSAGNEAVLHYAAPPLQVRCVRD
jgi:hypothetical protein